MRTFILLVFTFFGLTLAAQMQKGDRLLSLVNSNPVTGFYTPSIEAYNVGQILLLPLRRGCCSVACSDVRLSFIR